ncbi:hypothetical protein [Lentzea atacamensis]|uniref:hypothetical protein n=1 Tax=Lentzea atacamensis TaxID=531938 RepID=UPI0011B3DC08|nr:hypothetical protein [Lentzea atacamensis]
MDAVVVASGQREGTRLAGERAASRANLTSERILQLASRRAELATDAGRASTGTDIESAVGALSKARRHAAEAQERLRESLGRAAAAHERAAQAHEQAAVRGGSDAEDHRTAAARHRAAAEADRRRAAAFERR